MRMPPPSSISPGPSTPSGPIRCSSAWKRSANAMSWNGTTMSLPRRRRLPTRRAPSGDRRDLCRARREPPDLRGSAARWPPGGSRCPSGASTNGARTDARRPRPAIRACAAVRSMPGPGSGDSSVGERNPALPRAAPDPSRLPSTTATDAPRSCNASALVSPMRPPPMTTTDFGTTRRRYPASTNPSAARGPPSLH